MKKVAKIVAVAGAGAIAVTACVFAAGCSKKVDVDNLYGVTREFEGRAVNSGNVSMNAEYKQTTATTDNGGDKKEVSTEAVSALSLKALSKKGHKYLDYKAENSTKMVNGYLTTDSTEEESEKSEIYVRDNVEYSFEDGALSSIKTDAPQTTESETVFIKAIEGAASLDTVEYVFNDSIKAYIKDSSKIVYDTTYVDTEYVCELTDVNYSVKRTDDKLTINLSYTYTHKAETKTDLIVNLLDGRNFESKLDFKVEVDVSAGNKKGDFKDPVTEDSVKSVLYADPQGDYSSVVDSFLSGKEFSVKLAGKGADTYTVATESVNAVSINNVKVYYEYNDEDVRKALAGRADLLPVDGSSGATVDGSSVKFAAGLIDQLYQGIENSLKVYTFGIDNFTFSKDKVSLKYVEIGVTHRRANPDYDAVTNPYEDRYLTAESQIFVSLEK